MQSNSIYTSNKSKGKRLSIAYEFIEELSKIQYWFFPFKELLLEDIKSVHLYLQRCMLRYMYKFMFTYLCLNFCITGSKAFLSRLGFILRILFITIRFFSVYLNYSDGNLKSRLIAYLINALLGITNPNSYLIDYAFLAILNSFLPLSIKKRFIVALGTGFINLLVFSRVIGANYLIMAFLLHCYILTISHYNDSVMNVFKEKLMSIQERTEVDFKSKSMFVASISHDLKNPLNSLLGCLDLLKNSANLTENEKNYLTTASYSGQIMTYLIGNILDTSKIEAGKFDIEKLPMDILAELSKVILIEKELSKKKGINMYTKVLTPLPKLVYGDAMRFCQVLINIIGNSIKFVSKGYIGITLSWTSSIDKTKTKDLCLIPPEEFFLLPESNDLLVKINKGEDYEEQDLQELPISVAETIRKYSEVLPEVRRTRFTRPQSPSKASSSKTPLLSQNNLTKAENGFDTPEMFRPKLHFGNNPSLLADIKKKKENVIEDSGLLVIDIIDTGIGINEEEQKKLFKPFNQANSSVRSQYGGTGLGLWITKQLIYLMSGFIELRSKPQKGTRFTIILPFKVVKDEDCFMKGFEECKTPSVDRTDITITKEPAEVAYNLRSNKRLMLTGDDKSLHKIRILLIEDENSPNDCLVKQVANQLKNTDCKLYYASYSEVIEVLKKEKYSFNIIAIISAEQNTITMKILLTIMKAIKDDDYKQMPMCVMSGKLFIVNIIDFAGYKEFGELNKVSIFTFPLKEGEFVRELNKLRTKAL